MSAATEPILTDERLTMRLTIVGCCDAFGSGGRFNTCFWLETGKATLLIDCGASSPVALRARGLDFGRVDAVNLEYVLRDIQSDCRNLHWDGSFL